MDTNTRSFERDLMAIRTPLKAFAISLCRQADRADDLVQETLKRAWVNQDSLIQNKKLKSSSVFRILHNVYREGRRKYRREVADSDGAIAAQVSIAPAQESRMDFLDFLLAFERLSPEQKQALLLVCVNDITYDDAALIAGCARGTMATRVRYARLHLEKWLGLDEPDG